MINLSVRRRRWSLLTAALALAVAASPLAVSSPAAADTSPCTDGSTPDLLSTVTCSAAGSYELAVPTGTTSVDAEVVGAGGGAGYPARAHIGGNAAEVTGTLTLPAGTAYLYVLVGAGGTGDNHGTSTGGAGSGVLALDSGHALLAKLAIAGGGGGGAYNGDGGDAGSAGNSDNAQAVSGPGQPGVGSTGGAGGTGNYAPGTAGGSNNPSTKTLASGGNGGAVPGGATGGGGAGGYAGGGGGGGSRGSILSSNVAGGGGGSSLASSYLGSAGIAVLPGTGGVQLPGLVASDGATGSVTLTFDGLAVPGAPTGVSATPGNHEATVSFTPPASDGGSTITGYTVTSSPGGVTKTCTASPCTVTGLTNGTDYTFTVHATNTNGDSAESSASTAVTPAAPPGAPTAVSAVRGDSEATVSFTAPSSNGGSAITGYTVTSSPGGVTKTCNGSPCTITGLTNGTSYTFTVHATTAAGDSVESAATDPVTPYGAPGRPTGVSAQPGDGEAEVSFTAPTDTGGLPITNYLVTSSPGGFTGACSSSPCTVQGLTNGTAYTFTVHANNALYSSPESDASTAVTPAEPPGAPTGVSATAGDGEATVSFTAPASDGGSTITGYTVTSSPDGITKTCTGSPCTITGLDNGTAYTFTVHATTAAGESVESDASTSVTPVGLPGRPTGASAQAGDGQAVVSFTAPTDDGGQPVYAYTVTSSPGGLTATCPSSPCTVSGLTNGTAYTFTVHATNDQGDSTESVATAAVTPSVPPGAPTGASATAGDGQASVSFTAPASDGGSPVTSYTVSSFPGGLTAACPGSPCVITGLDNGTSYTFTVHATNDAGDSVESVATTSVTPVGDPGVPTGVSVAAGNGQASVSFTAPADDGGSPVTSYTVTSSPGGVTATCPDSPCVITGLDNGTSYTFTVHATNTHGDSAESSASTSVTPAAPPGAPTGASATAGDGQASVSFTAPGSTGGSPVTSYTVTSSPGGITATCDSSPCLVTGLDNGTAYTFTVHATNAKGDSVESTATTSVTPVGPPGGPGTVTVTPGDGSVSVSFPEPADGGSPINGYQVSTDGGLTWQTLFATTAGGTVTGTVTGLTNGTSYQVQVRAVNTNGNGTASTAHTVVPRTVPGAPTAVRTRAGDRQATVSFTAPDDGGAAISRYQYSLDGGTTWRRLDTTADGSRLSGVVPGLRNGTTYQVLVRAVNPAGPGESSGAVAVKPTAPPTGWFKDPLSRAQRARLVAIPAHPSKVHGRLRTTRALYRTHAGRLAVPLSTARGHQLSRRQAVEVERLFRFDSASLSASGRHQMRVLAASMRHVHALTCEGYTDYSGTDAHHRALSRHRALTVCRALHRLTGATARPVGYGDARPVKIGGRQLSRFPNRRVVVVVTR